MATPAQTRSTPPAASIRYTGCFIDGHWVSSSHGKTFPTINPATEEVLAEVAEASEEDVDRAVRAARKALEDSPWSRTDARDRGRLMLRLADLIDEHGEELATLDTMDCGKPIRDARGDVPMANEALRYYAGYTDKMYGQTIPTRGPHLTYTRLEPVGVVGQIIPWNFPLVNAVWKLAPALAAGCTMVLKPAEQTPLSSLLVAQLAQEAGIPDGVINVVPGDGPHTGAAIVRHPGVDKIAFTGETRTGQLIMRESAATMKRLTFELGGKSPNIIFADADIDVAAMTAHAALYANQGQICCAGSRLYVEDKVYDQVVERLAEQNRKTRLGDPLDPQTEAGPLVSKEQFDRVLQYIDSGRQEGADCVTGGRRWGQRGFFIERTLFTGVSDPMRIAREEIFGPVLSVLRFSDIEDVIRRANDTCYGLAAAVWTRDLDKAHLLAAKIKAGTVWVNCYFATDVAAPVGGFKMSGLGRELGEEGLRPYYETKTVTVRLNR